MTQASRLRVPGAPPHYPGEILRCVVGSEVFGLSKSGTSDIDLMGVCVEAPSDVVGLGHFEQHRFRTKREGERSGPGDVDCTVYGLRKFMRLAVKGNPTILTLFFVPEEYRTWDGLLADDFRSIASKVIARSAAGQFLGYLTAQKERMLGTRGGAHVNRPELVEQFGFDVKYAMHAVRLGLQGIELMTTGQLSMPMQDENRRECMAIRQGEVAQVDVIDRIEEIEQELARLRTESPLRESPDVAAVNAFLYEMYRANWDKGYR